jgi:ABC-type uncharacterized transport system fused permease/ATPase subunit
MGLFSNIFLLYLCIAIACIFYNPSLVIGESLSTISWLNIDINHTTNEPYFVSTSTYNDDATKDTPSNTSVFNRMLSDGRDVSGDIISGVGNFFMSVIDPIWQVIKFVGLLFKILFAPIIILTSAELGIPIFIAFAIGIPINFLGLLSLIMLIRGYS